MKSSRQCRSRCWSTAPPHGRPATGTSSHEKYSAPTISWTRPPAISRRWPISRRPNATPTRARHNRGRNWARCARRWRGRNCLTKIRTQSAKHVDALAPALDKGPVLLAGAPFKIALCSWRAVPRRELEQVERQCATPWQVSHRPTGGRLIIIDERTYGGIVICHPGHRSRHQGHRRSARNQSPGAPSQRWRFPARRSKCDFGRSRRETTSANEASWARCARSSARQLTSPKLRSQAPADGRACSGGAYVERELPSGHHDGWHGGVLCDPTTMPASLHLRVGTTPSAPPRRIGDDVQDSNFS